ARESPEGARGTVAHGGIGIVEEFREERRHPSRTGRLPCGTPSHVPRDQLALTRVTPEQPEERGRDASLLVRHLDRRGTPPRRQPVPRPRERAIEMAEVARVGTPGIEALCDAGAVDAMAANGLQETERGVRHVAVLTPAALAGRRVMRVAAALRS